MFISLISFSKTRTPGKFFLHPCYLWIVVPTLRSFTLKGFPDICSLQRGGPPAPLSPLHKSKEKLSKVVPLGWGWGQEARHGRGTWIQPVWAQSPCPPWPQQSPSVTLLWSERQQFAGLKGCKSLTARSTDSRTGCVWTPVIPCSNCVTLGLLFTSLGQFPMCQVELVTVPTP